MKTTILKVLVGSRAHGLHNEDSDYDYRGVFMYSTSELVGIHKPKDSTTWIEGKVDDTAWEVGKFLLMATKCNPTVLETFKAERVRLETKHEYVADKIQELFPHVWNSNDVRNAFIGYGINQRKKFFKNQDNRAPKYACAYLRVLYQAQQLLSTGTFDVDMTNSPIFEILKRFKAGKYEVGEVINECWNMETEVLKAYKQNPDKETNIEPVNEFLLKLRKENW